MTDIKLVEHPDPSSSKEKGRPVLRMRSRTSLFAVGEPMIWLTAGSLVICLAMIVGLLVLILIYGMSTFWPKGVVKILTYEGHVYMGEITRSEEFRPQEQEEIANRRLIRTGNFRLTQNHFQWVEDYRVKEEEEPQWALVVERMEWGAFYGFPEAFVLVERFIPEKDEEGNFRSMVQKKEEARRLLNALKPRHGGELLALVEVWGDDGPEKAFQKDEELDSAFNILAVAEVVEGPKKVWALFQEFHGEVCDRLDTRLSIEKHGIGDVNDELNAARLNMREAQLDLEDAEAEYGSASPEYADAMASFDEAHIEYKDTQAWSESEVEKYQGEIREVNEQNSRFIMFMKTAGEEDKPPMTATITLDQIVRAYPANQLSFTDKVGVYLSRWWEYLTDEPREANSEGGVFPAIFGTVVMTLLMALAVVPFGVLAALYLREYAKAGPVVSAVRIAVNNLAGVPSIVFGVFGLGFFCYGVGSFIDGGPGWVMPKPAWFIILGAASIIGAVAFLTFLGGLKRPGEEITKRQRVMRLASITLWTFCALTILVLVATTPFFDGFYRANLPNPTFGKGALIWASFTLALLTLPVVIVATEEALAAVPNSMREGSYACGASKWQTILRIVMPRALPGIMTGMILAMARGAGEVAPLMLVGAVKMAPKLPFDWSPPFGIDRSFMHLGFHIYDVGFQSQNSEAAKPMVYTTTLLLILIVAVLNISAIWLRSRLRKRFVASHF